MPVVDDNSLVAQYIRALENPDSIGYNNGIWEAPRKKVHDSNNRGFGVDVMYNAKAHALTNGRSGRWLTEAEERALRNEHIGDNKNTLEKYYPSMLLKQYPSETKQAMALGMLYRGDGIGSLLHNPEINEAYLSGTDEDMQRAVSNFYKKKIPSRATSHNNFFDKRIDRTSSINKKKTPDMIRRNEEWQPKSFKDYQFQSKYAEGGKMNEDHWNSLSMKDKAEMMKVAIAHGITTLPEIRKAYNKFAEGGDLHKQKDEEYEAWLRNEARLNSPLWGLSYEETLKQMQENDSYDYRKFYELQKKYPNNPKYQRDFEGNAHYDDVGKSVYHPTASKGSYYSGRKDPRYNPTGVVFGDWLDDGHEYRMSEDMLRVGRNPYDTFNYLSDAENQGVRLRDERGYMFQDYREPERTYIDGVLPEVIVTPNKKHSFGGNLYGNGGYVPSDRLQKDIATWEGAEMKRNAPFSEVTRQFNAVIPADIRAKLSTNQLDALYSYGYNVGMGNLKKRVLPVLTAYTKGKASNEDVQKSMWASRDSELRGLTRRRNWEREMFGGNYRSQYTGKPSSYEIPQSFFDNINEQIQIPQVQMPDNMATDPETIYKAPKIDETLFVKPEVKETQPVHNPQQEKLQGLQNLYTVMGMFGQSAPFSVLANSADRGPLGILAAVNGIYENN